MSIKCVLADQLPESGVTSFNGRKGDVTPQNGDYTAAQVGARPSTWTPTASEVGALPSGGTAAAATKLATARRVRTNLASTSTVSFDGTADITPGITGILPIANGGTGVSDLKSLYLALQEFEPVWSGWGRQDDIGDATWWANLKTWLSTSTAEQRQKCVGLTKKVSLSTPVLGANAATMVCIGADQDKNAYSQCYSLTFQTLGTLPNTTVFGSNALWNGSAVQTLCNDFATYCSAKDSIMSSYYSKLTSSACNGSRTNSADVSTTMKVWIPSEQEMGLNNYSPSRSETSSTGAYTLTNNGYSYYNSNTRRIKYQMNADGSLTTNTMSYWERSRGYGYASYVCCVYNGIANNTSYHDSLGFAPAFVIAHYQGAIAS